MWSEKRITNHGELNLIFSIPKNVKYPNAFDIEKEFDELLITETKNAYKIYIKTNTFSTLILDFVFRLNLRRYSFKSPSLDYFSPELDIIHHRKSSKEITEAGAAVYWCQKALQRLKMDYIIDDPNTICYVIADGTKPRTGVMLLYSTKWDIIVTDPVMEKQWLGNKYDERLTCFNELSQDLHLKGPSRGTEMVIVIGVHSHADYSEFHKRLVDFYDVPLLMVSIPCCKGFVHTIDELEPLITVEEHGIFSPKNKVLVYYDP